MGGWSTLCPGQLTPEKETRYPLYKRLGGPQARSGRVRKSRSQELDPRTVQDVASSYTDYAVPTQSFLNINIRSKLLSKHFISLSVRDHLAKPYRAEHTGAPTLLSGNFSVQQRTCIIDYRGAHYTQHFNGITRIVLRN